MKLAIIGSRTFDSFAKGWSVFLSMFPEGGITEIVSGGAQGADAVGKAIAKKANIPYREFPAEWKVYGRSAGMKRNVDIINACDEVLAFWDGQSRGTAHSLSLARSKGKVVHIHTFTPPPPPRDPLDDI